MKKYDFCLLALYVCLVAVFFIVVWRYESRNIRERKEGMRYFEEIYRTPIKTVVFRNTDAVVMVYGAGKNCLENGLEAGCSSGIGRSSSSMGLRLPHASGMGTASGLTSTEDGIGGTGCLALVFFAFFALLFLFTSLYIPTSMMPAIKRYLIKSSIVLHI